jgi:clan AA aspartic protease (TIGR02281 family)
MIFKVGKIGRRLLALLTVSLCFLHAPVASADAYYDQGVALYNKRNFKGAAPYFEYAIRNSPSDSNAYYYAALTYQQLSDWPRARQMYRHLVEKFPDSQGGGLARGVLQKYDPDFMKRVGAQASSSAGSSPAAAFIGLLQSGSGGSADFDQLPNEGKIYFQRVGNSQHIEADVNGRKIMMVFDTGAESCVFGKNHLRELGVTPPSGPPVGQSFGVGSSSPVGTWQMQINLKVGNIERRNFSVIIQDVMPTEPLLGQTFFKDFLCTTDPGAKTISFRKRGTGGSAAASNYDVPFKREGNEMVVNVLVNGKSCPMYFDTGADNIAFTFSQVKNLALEIPDDAQIGQSMGIGGTTRSIHFSVDRMKLGPIEKSNVEVSVVENASMPKPLLGQNFYRDWQFTVDSERNVIHFLRR